VVKTGGANGSPGEVEAVPASYPGLRVATAVGVPHPTLGEVLVVCAVPVGGVPAPDEAAIQDFVRERDALAKARASAREPAEAELSQIFAAGDLAGTEERARTLLARWPDSDVGRRITRALEEQRRRDQATELLASARHGQERSPA